MSRVEKNIIIESPQGLHARPAAMLVQLVAKFKSDVAVEKDGEIVSGKSIMGLLTLGLQQGSDVKIVVEGEDAQATMDSIVEFLAQKDFG